MKILQNVTEINDFESGSLPIMAVSSLRQAKKQKKIS